MHRLSIWFEMLMYEDGELSLTRTLAVVGWLAFLAVSAYLVIDHVAWSNYDTFASLTGGGGAATQVANKLINSKYNTEKGSYISESTKSTINRGN